MKEKKIARSFRFTKENLKTIEDHRELIKVADDSEALRDILDNAHKYRHWRDLMILKHWRKLESLGLSLDNVRYVIHDLETGRSPQKSSVKRDHKIAKIVKGSEIKI